MQDQSSPMKQAMQLAQGFAHLKVMYALIKSGVTEELADASRTLDELAEACNLNAEVLFRVLRYASGINLVALEDGDYTMTESGQRLLKDKPGSIYDIILLLGSKPWQKTWSNLTHSLATGEAAFEDAMGKPFFEYTKDHPEHGNIFDDWMTVESEMMADLIPEAYDFSDCDTVCDIGGSRGILLKSILQSNPGLRGILFDKPEVVAHHELNGLEEKVEVEGGDFFESVPEADVMIMKHIIHDWKDQQAVEILQTCKQGMDEDAKLLLVERVLDDDNDQSALFFDLHMQVMNGGRERTADDFDNLLQQAGLKLNRIIPTASPINILEATL